MRPVPLIAALTLACAAASAQLQELFSKYVRVYAPQGDFAPRLIKQRPAAGRGWRTVENTATGFRIAVPASAEVDTTPAESRVLKAVLSGSPTEPRPVLNVYAFTPKPDEPAVIDADYAEAFAAQYGQARFGGKFVLTDSGYVVLGKKLSFAMAGGTYAKGAARVYRHEWAYLDPARQLYVTFDCAEADWPGHADTVAQILLSLEIPKGR